MLAVAMLNGLTAKTEARRISLSVSRPSLISAQLADVIATFYRARPAGSATGGVGAITEGMLGMPEGAAPADDTPVLASVLSKKAADGTPLYPSPITRSPEHRGERGAHPQPAARAARRQRRDRDGRSCDRGRAAAGPVPIGAADHGEVQSSWSSPRDRFRPARPRRRSSATSPRRGSCLPSGRRRSLPSDRKSERRCRIRARASTRTSRGRPRIRWSTRTARPGRCRTMRRPPRWRRCSTPSIPRTTTSRCRDPGTISVLDDGRTRFTPAADGKHRYVIVDPAQKERITTLYTAMVSAPPAPRPGRGRGAQE